MEIIAIFLTLPKFYLQQKRQQYIQNHYIKWYLLYNSPKLVLMCAFKIINPTQNNPEKYEKNSYILTLPMKHGCFIKETRKHDKSFELPSSFPRLSLTSLLMHRRPFPPDRWRLASPRKRKTAILSSERSERLIICDPLVARRRFFIKRRKNDFFPRRQKKRLGTFGSN